MALVYKIFNRNRSSMKKLKESYFLVAAQYLTLLLPLATTIEKVPPEIAGSAVTILFLLRSIIFRKWDFLKNDWVRLGLGFWLFQMASCLWAYDARTAIVTGFIWGRFLFFGAAMAYWVLDDEKMHMKLLYSIMLALAYLSVDSIYQYYSGFDLLGKPKFSDRLTGPFDMPRVGSAVLFLIFPLISYAICAPIQWQKRLPYMLMSMLAVMTVIMSGDRSPAVLLLLEFVLLFLIFIRNKKIIPYIALIVMIAFAIVLQLQILDRFSVSQHNYIADRQVGSTIDLIKNFSHSPYGLLTQDTIELIEKHWLLGVGAGNFRIYLCKMGNMKYFDEGCLIHPHNTYLDVLSSVGLVGLAIYLLLIFSVLRRLYQKLSVWSSDALTSGIATGFMVRVWPIIFATAYTRSYSGFTMWLMAGWALNRIDRKQKLL